MITVLGENERVRPMAGHFEITTTLRASAERVWQHAASIEGILFELQPWLAMTVPRGLDAAAFTERLAHGGLPLPSAIGKSWVLLFGLLPFDWDDMVIVELEPGRRFLEQSRMLSLRSWQHERVVEASQDGGAALTDRLAWEPRAGVPKALANAVVSAIFRHRHVRLHARFG